MQTADLGTGQDRGGARDAAAGLLRLRAEAMDLARILPERMAAQAQGLMAAIDDIEAALRESGSDPAVTVDAPHLLDRLLDLAGPEEGGELLRRLDEDLGTVARQMQDGLERKDGALLRSASHVLISLSGSVGALALSDRGRKLNDAIHGGEDLTALMGEGQDLIGAITHLRSELRGWRPDADLSQESSKGAAGA